MSDPTAAPPVEIEIAAPSLSESAVGAFRNDVTVAAAARDVLRAKHELPEGRVRVLLAEDFVGEVSRLMRPLGTDEEAAPFTDIRAAGSQVVAKNLPQNDQDTDVVIVFSAAHWTHAAVPIVRARLGQTIAHELVHPLVERTRRAGGLYVGVPLPSRTPLQGARSGARIWLGEYRADMVGDYVAGAMFGMTPDGGEPQEFRSWFVTTWIDDLASILEEAGSLWPDTVQEYREWRMPVGDMIRTIGQLTDQTLTLLVHAQAGADAADTGIDVLSAPQLSGLPAVKLYLADTFPPFLEAMRTAPLLPAVDDVATVDNSVADIGEAMTIEIWRRLGLTFRDVEDGYSVDVGAPLR